MLEPKDDRIVYKDWDKMASEIGNLGLMDDDEQPLPSNVMYPGTSKYCECRAGYGAGWGRCWPACGVLR